MEEAAGKPKDIRDETGELNEEAVHYAPMNGAAKDPGFFSLAYHTMTGSATSRIKAQYWDNPAIQAIARQFNLEKDERQLGINTIAEDSQIAYGQYENAARDFLKAPIHEQWEAWNRKAAGEANLDLAVDRALADVLNNRIVKDAATANRGDIDYIDGLWNDPNYLPIHELVDYDKMYNDQAATMERAKAHLKDPSKWKKVENILESAFRQHQERGTDLHTGADRRGSAIQANLIMAMKEAVRKGKPVKAKAIINRLKQPYEQQQKRTAQTLERALSDLDQDFFTAYYKKDIVPSDALRVHMKKAAESLSHVNRFGADFKKFDEMVADAIERGYEMGKPITEKDIEKLYDVLRVSQRIHLKPLSKDWRERQIKAKAGITTLTLGLASLVSIPEMISIPLATDMKSALKGFTATLKRDDANYVAAEDLGLSIGQAVNMTLNRTTEELINVPKWEQLFIKMTGLPYVQHFLTVWAAKSQDIYFKRMLDGIRSGRLEKSQANHLWRKLAEAGIDVEQATKWADEGYQQEAEFYKDEWLPKLLAATRDTIIDPDPVDKPLWQSDERMGLVAQLKAFMTVFTHRVMRGTAKKVALEGPGKNRELAMRVAPYATMYILGQMAMGAAREVIKDGEIDEERSIAQRAGQAFAYMGSVAYFIDPIMAAQYRSDVLTSFAGPAAGIGIQLFKGTVEGVEDLDADKVLDTYLKRLYPNTPFKGLVLEAMGVD
jgi:hypothetical protein